MTDKKTMHAPAPIMLLASTATHDHMGAWFIIATADGMDEDCGAASRGPSPPPPPPSSSSAAWCGRSASPPSSISKGATPSRSPFPLWLPLGTGEGPLTPKGLNEGERRPRTPPPPPSSSPPPSEAAACCCRGVYAGPDPAACGCDLWDGGCGGVSEIWAWAGVFAWIERVLGSTCASSYHTTTNTHP